MTVFRKSSDGKAWSAIRVERPLPEELEGLVSTGGQQSRDPLDPENYRHWEKLPGGDEEVDFDNLTDNDEETARQIHKEILKERQDRSQKPKKLTRRSKGIILSRKQVLDIIARAIENFVKSWEAKQAKYPSKVQRKAWRLWQRTLRQGIKDAFINELTEMITHLGARLQKIRDEIVQLVWSTDKAVLKQAQSMQPTVVEQETAKWQRDVLQCLTAPEKPPPAEPKKPKSAKQALAGRDQELADLQLRRYSTERVADEDDNASASSHMRHFVVEDELNVAEAQIAPNLPVMGPGVANRKVNPNWPVMTNKGPLRPLFPNWGKKRMQMEAEQKAAKQKAAEEKTAEQKAKGELSPDSTIQSTADSATPSAEIASQAVSLKRGNTSPDCQNKKQKLDTVSSAVPEIVDLTRSSEEFQDTPSSFSHNTLPAKEDIDKVGFQSSFYP